MEFQQGSNPQIPQAPPAPPMAGQPPASERLASDARNPEDVSNSRDARRSHHHDRSDSRDRRSRHYHSRSRDRRSRSHRDHHHSRDRSRRHHHHEENDNEESLTRDFCTVFVSDLQVKVDEKWLRHYFQQAGKVKSIKLIRDKNSGRSKGMGYIEMGSQEDCARALLLNGQKMCTKHKACNCSGFPMKVKRSEAEKNWSAMKEKAPPKILPSTIYVTNLDPQLTRRDILDIFGSVGDVENATLETDSHGVFHGTAYVKFRRPECASRAAVKMDGEEVLGRKMKVTLQQRRDGRNWRLEDEEQNENVALDPQRRTLLMRHLAESKKDADLTRMIHEVNNPGQVATASMGADGKPVIEGNASNCLVLKNMFLAAAETDPNWD
ncbi:hypothetical protein WA556_001499, partial [Blastocystis sp. ATCC 50177/Nand II]